MRTIWYVFCRFGLTETCNKILVLHGRRRDGGLSKTIIIALWVRLESSFYFTPIQLKGRQILAKNEDSWFCYVKTFHYVSRFNAKYLFLIVCAFLSWEKWTLFSPVKHTALDILSSLNRFWWCSNSLRKSKKYLKPLLMNYRPSFVSWRHFWCSATLYYL